MYNFLNKKWFFDKIYNEYFAQKIFNISFVISYKTIDKGIVEIFGPKGLSALILNTAGHLLKLQTTMLYQYALLMLIGITLILLVNNFHFHTLFFSNFYNIIYLSFFSILFYNFYYFE